MSALVYIKVLAAVTMLIVSGIGCFLAYGLSTLPKFRLWMNRVSLFASGAFIGLGVFHLLPEALHSADHVKLGWKVHTNWYNGCYPLIFIGFASIYIIERLLGLLCGNDGCCCHNIKVVDDADESECIFVKELTPEQCEKELLIPSAPQQSVSFSSVVLLGVVGLAIHSLFEGVVLGLMDDATTVWVACLAVIGHKLPVAISLGVSCLKHNIITTSAVWYLAVFCLSTPVGVVAGIFVSCSAHLISAIASSISVGVLLYAGCEALFDHDDHDNMSSHDHESGGHHKEEHKKKSFTEELICCLCFLFGGFMILGMMMCHLATGSHNHGHPVIHDTGNAHGHLITDPPDHSHQVSVVPTTAT